MAEDLTAPSPAIVLDLLEAFRRSKTMFVGVSLGVFDSLTSGAKSARQLADELHLNEAALARVLDASVGLKLLTRSGDKYANTHEADAYLTKKSPRRMTGYINYSNDVTWKLYGNLEGAVREGTHRWHETYGWDGPIFSHFFKTDEAREEFLMGMHGFGVISSPQVVTAFDLSKFKRFVDLGGATGHLVAAACQRYPAMQGVLFDLPDAIPLAKKIVGATPVANRIEFVAGDFFVDPLPSSDLYALGRIIHDWSEEKVARLLTRIFEALPSGGALLVCEKIILEGRDGPSWAQMQDLNMLTCTEGRERTLSEYDSLLRGIGFREVRGMRTPSPLDAVLAIKG